MRPFCVWILLSSLLAGLTLPAGGCAYHANARLTLGGRQLPPTFDPDPKAATQTSPDLFGDAPTPRSTWAPTLYIAPFDGVVNGYALRMLPRHGKSTTPRRYGRFPRRSDALRAQSWGWARDVRETFHELGRALIGTPYALITLGFSGELGRPIMSPTPYKRTPRQGWASGRPAPSIEAHETDEPTGSPTTETTP